MPAGYPATIRPERESDRAAVHAVNAAVFKTGAEAALVDERRRRARPLISLVAERAEAIVGHILFSPVALDRHPGLGIMGLGPMAVQPAHRSMGIGSALVHAGLERCRALGIDAVVVLGHPLYYPRFGFAPAARFGIDCEYDAPAGTFMIIELNPGCLAAASGVVKYHPAFGDV